MLPTSGPLAGGTSVILHGVNLANGTHYKCRFGGPEPPPARLGPVLAGPVPGSLPLEQYMTPATYIGAAADVDHAGVGGRVAHFGEVLGAGAVRCVSPNASVITERIVTVELSVNGQEYTQQGLAFGRHAPILSSVYPTTGPLSGGFRIELRGADLIEGTVYMCRFQRLWPVPSTGAPDAPNATMTSTATTTAGEQPPMMPPLQPPGAPPFQPPPFQPPPGALGGNASNYTGVASPDVEPPSRPAWLYLTTARLVRDATADGRASPHDAVVCQLPSDAKTNASLQPADVLSVAISLNGQQYTSSSESARWWPTSTAQLQVYAPPVISSISPSSGPADGGTRIVVAGASLGGGGNYSCRFGDHAPYSLPGTFAVAAGAVHCVSPAVGLRPCASPSSACNAASELHAMLSVAPNGQDYAKGDASALEFVSFRPPSLLAISPSTGPSAGGTLVVVEGLRRLSGGSDYRCRFAGVPTGNSTDIAKVPTGNGPGNETASVEHLTVVASFDEASGTVRCTTPPLYAPKATVTATVLVALNAQQYLGAAVGDGLSPLQYGYYGAPAIESISPSCGPSAGATNITLSGTQLTGGSHYLCRFGEAPGVVSASTAAQHERSSGNVWCVAARMHQTSRASEPYPDPNP